MTESSGVDRETVVLACRTVQSRIEVVEAARTRLWLDGERVTSESRHVIGDDEAALELRVELTEGGTCRVEKVVVLFTSRDAAISEPREAALEAVARAGSFTELLASHVTAWDGLWRRYETRIEGLERAAQALNVHLFHLLQVASHHAADLDVGVPARGLHGEAYRGHIFWDELFIFPMLTYRVPEVRSGADPLSPSAAARRPARRS